MTRWNTYEPDADSPWNWQRVVHLHRRAAYGANWDRIKSDLAGSPQEAVERVLNGDTQDQPDNFQELSEVIADAAVTSGDPERLQAWWLYRLLFAGHPLREKLTLLWHDHFATSNLKVNNLAMMLEQNQKLRSHALGSFGSLLEASVKDPAMLMWLDADANRQGRPNENLARELLELFTLGLGNYAEQDVKQVARALTGWTVSKGKFVNKSDRHDKGDKTILGTTAEFDGDALLELLLRHAATSRRIASRLCECLMGENVVTEQDIDELATGLRQHDLSIAWAVDTILSSQLFFSDENLNSRVSNPVESMVTPLRSLNMTQRPPSTVILAEWCSRIGQELFYPPNVGGWPGGRAWLSTSSIVARANFATALVNGHLRAPTSLPDLSSLVGSVKVTHSDLSGAVDHFSRLLCGREMSRKDVSSIVSDASGQPRAGQINGIVACVLSSPQAFVT